MLFLRNVRKTEATDMSIIVNSSHVCKYFHARDNLANILTTFFVSTSQMVADYKDCLLHVFYSIRQHICSSSAMDKLRLELYIQEESHILPTISLKDFQ